METEKKPLVQVKNLKKYFNTGHKEVVKALDNVSFDIFELLIVFINNFF